MNIVHLHKKIKEREARTGLRFLNNTEIPPRNVTLARARQVQRAVSFNEIEKRVAAAYRNENTSVNRAAALRKAIRGGKLPAHVTKARSRHGIVQIYSFGRWISPARTSIFGIE